MAESGRRERRIPVPRPPTPLARRFVRYVVGFGVAVGIGLAPFLGQLDLPLFTPLLHLIPRSLRDTLLPLSAALMGLVAVVVQWLGEERLTKTWLRKAFRRTLTVAGVSFLLLLVLHAFLVVRVPIPRTDSFESFIVGFVWPEVPDCRGYSLADCLRQGWLPLDERVVASLIGARQITLASLCLELAYLVFTGSFAALVGLVVLRTRPTR